MYVIAYDIGTTGLKTCLFEITEEKRINLVADASEGYDLYTLPNGGSEQDPQQWWDAMCNTTRKLLQETGIPKENIKGISFCAQMQAVVLVDKDGNHLMNSMGYMDTRGTEQIDKLMYSGFKIAGLNAWKLLRSLQITKAVSGSVKDPVFKYRWVADNDPELFSKVYKWLDVKDYLVMRATGKFTMSRDSAFSTMLFDSRPGKECFSAEVCRMMDVNIDHLPEVVQSTDNVGGMTAKAAGELGLAEGTPVFSGGGDATLIGVGAGASRIGDTHIYMGTSGWVTTVIAEQKLDITTMIASPIGPSNKSYNCFAELETAGKCLDWARGSVGIESKDDPFDLINERIKDVPAGSNGVMFTPWLHGNRNPFEDPNARGMFFNMGLETSAEDMIHAVIEGVCLHLRWQAEAMSKLTPISDPVRFVGGGARSAVTCQILADVLGKKVETVDSPHNVGSVGAAAVIATGLGIFEYIEDINESIPATATYYPRKANTEVYDKLFSIFQNLYKANKKNFFNLNA